MFVLYKVCEVVTIIVIFRSITPYFTILHKNRPHLSRFYSRNLIGYLFVLDALSTWLSNPLSKYSTVLWFSFPLFLHYGRDSLFRRFWIFLYQFKPLFLTMNFNCSALSFSIAKRMLNGWINGWNLFRIMDLTLSTKVNQMRRYVEIIFSSFYEFIILFIYCHFFISESWYRSCSVVWNYHILNFFFTLCIINKIKLSFEYLEDFKFYFSRLSKRYFYRILSFLHY